MASLDSAIIAMRGQIRTILSGANLTQRGKVLTGSITPTEWEEIAGQDTGGALVTVLPIGPASYKDPNPVNYQVLVAPVAGTTATLSSDGSTCTIGGIPKVGDTVHLFFSQAFGHARYGPVKANDTPTTIAAGLATSVSASGISGVTGSASGAVTTIAGSYFEKVNVGAAGSAALEVARVKRTIQVTVWTSSANDPNTRGGALNDRAAIGEAIITNLGTAINQWITDASGDVVFVTQAGDRWDDMASDSYTTFRWDILFDIVYSVLSTFATEQLEAIENINVTANNAPITIYVG